MKKQYMKPTMRVFKIQQRHIICSSPYDMDGKSLQMRSGSGNQINSEDDVW